MNEQQDTELEYIQACPAPGRADTVNRRYLFVTGVAGLGLAALVYVFGVLPGQNRDRVLANWIEVEGTILSVSIEEESRTEPWGNSQREYVVYLPEFVYNFDFEGTKYESQTFSVDEESYRSREQAEELLSRFAIGASVPVYVNPQDANESVLMIEASPTENVLYLGSLMLALLGGLGLAMGFFWPKPKG